MNYPGFRVRGKIFSTLWEKEKRGVLMLTHEQQEVLTKAEPKMFDAVRGGWGLNGWASSHLAAAAMKNARSAPQMGRRNTAPKSLI